MAYPYNDRYNPIPRRLREPTPGYSQTRLPGTERTVVETPRGGFSPDPADGLSERDLTPENYAMPFSATRSMRYGPGDERDLGAPVLDPRSPLAPSPADWGEVRPYGSGRAAFDGRGGYAYTDAPAVPDQSTPRPLFSGVAGEDFEATRRRGEQVAKLMRETDGPFANPNDWNYVRSYGPRAAAQAVASGRANISGAPAELVAQERERFLRNRTTDLSISPQLRSAARDELAQIERDAAEERRREMWAEEQAARLEGARIAAGVPVSFGGGAGVVPDGEGGWTPIQPPTPEAKPTPPPAPVSFGAGAGVIPRTDENGVTTWEESRPQAPLYSTTPRGEVYNNQTGDITHEVTTAGQDKNGRKRFVVMGRLVDEQGNVLFDGQPTKTEQTLARKYAERQAAIRANAGMLDPQTLKDIDAEIAALEAKLEEEHAAPAATGGGETASEPPAPAAQPAGRRRFEG